jgi:hypothetical protein
VNLFLSPFSDGPVNFNTTLDGKMNIRSVSRFGRSFSIVRIPYALKLLIQELQVMNVQMRIITEDNVDQLLSMSYSDNINKLLQTNTPLEEISKNYRTIVINKTNEERINQVYIPREKPEYPDIGIEEKKSDILTTSSSVYLPNTPEEYKQENVEQMPSSNSSPPYAPGTPPLTESPPYAPASSPPYAPVGSPPYAPTSSPPYAPVGSPPYAPVGSPPYAPVGSPPYAPGTPINTSSSGNQITGGGVGTTTIPLGISIDDLNTLQEIIKEKQNKQDDNFEPILFEKPKKESSILDIEVEKSEVDNNDKETISSSNQSSGDSSSSEKKVIKIT